jgi:hypothetical protein
MNLVLPIDKYIAQQNYFEFYRERIGVLKFKMNLCFYIFLRTQLFFLERSELIST